MSVNATQSPVTAQVTTNDPVAELDLDALTQPIAVKKPTVSGAGVNSATVAAADSPTATAAPVTAEARQHAAVVLDNFRTSVLARVEKRGHMVAANKIKDQIASMTQFDIGKVGATDQEGVRTQSAAMLEGTKASELGEAGKVLMQVTQTMQGFDMKVQEKVAGIGNWFSDKKKIAEAAFSAWKVNRAQVNTIVEQFSDDLFNRAANLSSRIGELEVAFNECTKALLKIDVSIAALSMAWVELNNETIPKLSAALQADPTNGELKQQLSDAREKAATIDRRIGSLGKSYTTIMQALPTIRLMQQNNNGLVEAMNTARTDTIAQWQLLLMQAQTLHEAKGSAEVLNHMAKLDADMRKQSAENLHDVTMSVQELIENGVTSYESLDFVNEKLKQTMIELYQKQQEAAKVREEAENRMEASNRELAKVVATGGKV